MHLYKDFRKFFDKLYYDHFSGLISVTAGAFSEALSTDYLINNELILSRKVTYLHSESHFPCGIGFGSLYEVSLENECS
jgi:hypothetical protein